MNKSEFLQALERHAAALPDFRRVILRERRVRQHRVDKPLPRRDRLRPRVGHRRNRIRRRRNHVRPARAPRRRQPRQLHEAAPRYPASCQRIGKMQKGINIVNGKKVLK